MEIGAVDYMKFVFALLFVLGLIGGLAVLGKRLGMGHRGPIGRGQSKRLRIVETMPLDAKRRVILISRDDKEHLLLLGNSEEKVIEGDIASAEARGPQSPPAPVLALETPVKAAR